ncbi:MAG: DUF115 domain-containing protein [Treponema sp.]|nr:DUF115 domain-containing protein [Treponema sp.]
MANIAQEKPCLVSTTQGFSVSYKEKLLYSKYNPSKSIIQAIEELKILPGTIILACSPLLDYGIEELYNKLPENSLILACEIDDNLRAFAKENLKAQDKIILLTKEEIINLPYILNKNEFTFSNGKCVEFSGNFKRILKVDFSAGVQFNQPFYQELYQASTKALMTFWSNRITLAKFGRRYSKNLFANLKNLEGSIPIENYFNKIEKPIIICGAGQSLDSLYKDIENKRDSFYILAADTALKALLTNKIIPDGVFLEEAQQVISKAFIGCLKYNFHLFAALTSLPQLGKSIKKENISYFTSLYTDSSFLNQLCNQDFMPKANQPLGSVGLTCLYYSLKFRKDKSIPIYIYGLDFSYSQSLTHAKNTPAHNNRLISTNRLLPIENYGAAFLPPSVAFLDKNQKKAYTTPILTSYYKLFQAYFSGQENIFDSGDFGFKLCNYKKPEQMEKSKEIKIALTPYSGEKIAQVNSYLSKEREELIELRDLLSGKIILTEEERNQKIKKIARKKEYLFLHFPDGYKFSQELSFLKRIRAEIDYFLKYI